jgi:RNA polymerase sigma-70 factor, ECF subfamily
MAERELDRTSLGDYLDRLYRAAWGLCGSREEAEDLVQETFVRVIARPRFLRKDDDLGYLLRTLKNTFLTSRRNAGRQPLGEPLDKRFEELQDHRFPGPAELVEAREVFGAIAGLPMECREAIVAIDVLGLSYAEAARALRVRMGTVTSRLFRARKLVAQSLQEVPVSSRSFPRSTPVAERTQMWPRRSQTTAVRPRSSNT